MKFLPDRQIILITGLRWVGKTTLLYQTTQHLLDEGVEPSRILYFSFDKERFDLEDVMQNLDRDPGERETVMGEYQGLPSKGALVIGPRSDASANSAGSAGG